MTPPYVPLGEPDQLAADFLTAFPDEQHEAILQLFGQAARAGVAWSLMYGDPPTPHDAVAQLEKALSRRIAEAWQGGRWDAESADFMDKLCGTDATRRPAFALAGQALARVDDRPWAVRFAGGSVLSLPYLARFVRKLKAAVPPEARLLCGWRWLVASPHDERAVALARGHFPGMAEVTADEPFRLPRQPAGPVVLSDVAAEVRR